MARVSAMISPVLVLFGCDLCFVRANRPPSPVNVTVTQLKANSATVSWDVPEGDVVIGYAILQQRQDGQMQRFIREVNTTNRACVLWDLAEDADYIIQVQSIGLYGESQASKRVHFRTLKETDRLPSNSSNQGDITMEGLDKDRQLQTGEIIIIVAVLLMWADNTISSRIMTPTTTRRRQSPPQSTARQSDRVEGCCGARRNLPLSISLRCKCNTSSAIWDLRCPARATAGLGRRGSTRRAAWNSACDDPRTRTPAFLRAPVCGHAWSQLPSHACRACPAHPTPGPPSLPGGSMT
uniref:fibronectin type III domain-containing protein 4 isoform X1 n=1 Tax=Lonchura striata TaxID=40157 RepID=UPI0012936F22|nr:fibronectin type III domain-containing protein 4 isoform X1 [Lonchura striata domestica]